MASGGGDGGAGDVQARADAEIARKNTARAAVNKIFGYGTDSSTSVPGFQRFNPNPSLGGFDPNSIPTDDGTAAANKAAREASYGKILTDTQNYFQQPLDEQTAAAQRQNKFSLLRRGLVDDSQTVEQNKLLERAKQTAMQNIETAGTNAANSARSADENSRLNILAQIDSGLDVGSATQTAEAELNQSGQNALATAKGTTLGDVFGNAGLLYSRDQYNSGLASAPSFLAALRAGMVGPSSSFSSSSKPYYGSTR
jgi:hypothetical protein